MTKKKKNDSKKYLITGAVMLVVTPVFYYGVGLLGSLSCQKTEYGSCTFDSNIQLVYTAIFLAAIYIVIALSFLIYGIFNRLKNK